MQQNDHEPRIDDMGRTYQELFSALPHETVPTHFCERVLGRIERERILHRSLRLVGASLSIAASAAGFVFAIPALIAAATQSGFSVLAMLALSDGSVVAGHFSTFLASLLETLPSAEILLVLALTALFLASLRGLFRSLPVSFSGEPLFSK